MLPLALYRLLVLAVPTAWTYLSLSWLQIPVSSKFLSPGGFVTQLFSQHFQLAQLACRLLGVTP